jgi:exonuclease VII small subunit
MNGETRSMPDNAGDEGRLHALESRISELEDENVALKEVNQILRRAVDYYAPMLARLRNTSP